MDFITIIDLLLLCIPLLAAFRAARNSYLALRAPKYERPAWSYFLLQAFIVVGALAFAAYFFINHL